MTHGFYFHDIEVFGLSSSATAVEGDYRGGSFPIDLTRRKVSLLVVFVVCVLPCLVCLALPCLALPCLAVPFLALPCPV